MSNPSALRWLLGVATASGLSCGGTAVWVDAGVPPEEWNDGGTDAGDTSDAGDPSPDGGGDGGTDAGLDAGAPTCPPLRWRLGTDGGWTLGVSELPRTLAAGLEVGATPGLAGAPQLSVTLRDDVGDAGCGAAAFLTQALDGGQVVRVGPDAGCRVDERRYVLQADFLAPEADGGLRAVLRCASAELLVRGVARDAGALLPGFSASSFFLSRSSYPSINANFGVYAVASSKETLFLAFGPGLPAEIDGALLATFTPDASVPSPVLFPDGGNPIRDQGLHELLLVEDTLLIPGTDPCCGSGPNQRTHLYQLSAPWTSLERHWTGLDVVDTHHAWGVWGDSLAELFLSTSSVTGDLFKSVDKGHSFTHEGSWVTPDAGTRPMALRGLGGNLFASVYVFDMANSANILDRRLEWSRDQGKTWTPIAGAAPNHRCRPVEFQGSLVVPDAQGDNLLVVSPAGQLRTLPMSPHRINVSGTGAYNALATDGRNLYAIAGSGLVLRSRDLVTWVPLARLPTANPLVTIGYWPALHALVVGDKGLSAGLWRIDL